MKEIRFFYVPNASTSVELPDDEASHALRVLRMESGDEMMLTDGNGYFYKAVVTDISKKRCFYRIEETIKQPRQWNAHLHLAMAPPKNMDRTEWFAEKATEIGLLENFGNNILELINSGIGNVNDLQKNATNYVSAVNQAKFLTEMMDSNFLIEEELDVVKRARNYKTTSHPKSCDIITYKYATGLEALIGYLDLKNNKERIEEIMNFILER